MSDEEKKALEKQEEEVKKRSEEINKKLDGLNQLIEKKADADKLVEIQDAILKDMQKLPKDEQFKKLQDQVDDMATKISDLSIKESQGESIDSQFQKMFKSDKYQNAKKNKGFSHEFDIKATINTANSFTQTNSPIIPYFRDPVIGIDPRLEVILSNLVSQRATNSDYIDWVERTAETTGTKMTAESAVFGASDASWTSYKVPVEKITDYIVCSNEKLEDTDFIQSEIMAVLGYNIPHKQEDEIWNGTGSSNRLYGMIGASIAKTFALVSGVGIVAGPNEFDCLGAAALQIYKGNNATNTKSQGFTPTAHIVNPVDYYNMSRVKTTDNQYVFGLDGVMRVGGVPIYQSWRCPVGYFLSGAFNRVTLYTRRAMAIKMWDQNSTDPIYDQVTFTATKRVALVTKNVDKFALVYGQFSAAKAALANGA